MRPKRAAAAMVIAMAIAVSSGGAHADPLLADFPYPYPVKRFELTSQREGLFMAHMDVSPPHPSGATIVLLHGKNFCGATWEGVMPALLGAGYRVIVPDQIGFCKSAKSWTYHYSLYQLAANTRALLASLGVRDAVMMGHSMGGMLALRFALAFPRETRALVLVNPIGLEDWQAKGVPAATIDELYEGERRTTFDSIKAYQEKTYYGGAWRPEFDRWPRMLASMYAGEGGDLVAWSQALTSAMIFAEPVVHELGRVGVPTLLMIGELDTTAIGKIRADPAVAKELGHYPELARSAAARIPRATLVTFPKLGHAPQIEDPAGFNARLLSEIDALGAGGRR